MSNAVRDATLAKVAECKELLRKLEAAAAPAADLRDLLTEYSKLGKEDKFERANSQFVAARRAAKPSEDLFIQGLRELLDLIKAAEKEGRDIENDWVQNYVHNPNMLTTGMVKGQLDLIADQVSVSPIPDFSDTEKWVQQEPFASYSPSETAFGLERELRSIENVGRMCLITRKQSETNPEDRKSLRDAKWAARIYRLCQERVRILARIFQRKLMEQNLNWQMAAVYSFMSDWNWETIPAALVEVMRAGDSLSVSTAKPSASTSPTPEPAEHIKLAYQQYRSALDSDESLLGATYAKVYAAIKRRTAGTGQDLPDRDTFIRYVRSGKKYYEPKPTPGAD